MKHEREGNHRSRRSRATARGRRDEEQPALNLVGPTERDHPPIIPPVQKADWEMTKAEYIAAHPEDFDGDGYTYAIQDALGDGEKVPHRILKAMGWDITYNLKGFDYTEDEETQQPSESERNYLMPTLWKYQFNDTTGIVSISMEKGAIIRHLAMQREDGVEKVTIWAEV